MSNEWSQCAQCGLKFRTRATGCPRCAAHPPPPEAQSVEVAADESFAPRITEHYTDLEGPPPFRAPWVLLAISFALAVLAAAVSGARLSVVLLLVFGGLLVALVAKIWSLVVIAPLGGAWVVGALFVPLVGIVGQFKVDNLRPLGLTLTASAMMGMGFLLGVVFPERHPPRAFAEESTARPSGAREAADAPMTRSEFQSSCAKKRDAFECGCLTAALFDEVGADVRNRVIEGTATPSDDQLVRLAVARNCPGRRR